MSVSCARPRRAPLSRHANTRRARQLAPRGRRPRAQPPEVIGRPPHVTKIVTDLLYFDSCTRVFKLFFDFCRLLLVDSLLDQLGRGFDQILGFLEAEAGNRPNLLDYVDLLLA